MSNTPDLSSFGKFIPGFDFLQTLSQQGAGGGTSTASTMPNWIAPTLNEEELNKRIDELKAVSFWLEQNATALKATIQALEVQKMTLATLKNMNFSFGANTATTDGDVAAKTEAGKVDAMQWWNALTQQFGQIATKTMQDAAAKVNETVVAAKASTPVKASKPKPKAARAAKSKSVSK